MIPVTLYNQMLGGIPDFNRGAVVAMIMLLPSVASIMLLRYLESPQIIVAHDLRNCNSFFVYIAHCVMYKQKCHRYCIDHITCQKSPKAIYIKRLLS